MQMKLQIFTIKKSIYKCLEVIGLDSTLKKDDNYYPQVFLNTNVCKYIEKKEIRHINNDLSYFSSFDESDEK